MYATDTLMDEREVVLRLIDGDEFLQRKRVVPMRFQGSQGSRLTYAVF